MITMYINSKTEASRYTT